MPIKNGWCTDCELASSECECRLPARNLITGQVLTDQTGKLLPDWKERSNPSHDQSTQGVDPHA